MTIDTRALRWNSQNVFVSLHDARVQGLMGVWLSASDVAEAPTQASRLEILQWLTLRGPLSVRGLREFIAAGDIPTQMRVLEVAGLVEVVGRVKAIGGPKLYVPGSLDCVARLLTGRGMAGVADAVAEDDGSEDSGPASP